MQLGNLIILRNDPIEVGPFGSLYLCQNPDTNEKCLAKVLDRANPIQRAHSDELQHNFMEGGRMSFVEPPRKGRNSEVSPVEGQEGWGQYRHPNILWVGAFFQANNTDVVELELFENGVPLDSEQLGGIEKLSVAKRLDFLANLANAIDHAHLHGLVHGNLTPRNILVRPSDWVPKVADFFGLNVSTTVPYTVDRDYRAPESMKGVRSQAADRYTFGALAFRLLLGRKPRSFADASSRADFDRIYREQPVMAPTESAWKACFCRALDFVPEQRFESCRDLMECLRNAVNADHTVPETIAKDSYEIQLNENYYVRVDPFGHLLESWAEGVFGCVLQLRGVSGDTGALKLPRLVATDQLENAFINRLMELEAATVAKVSEGGGMGLMTSERSGPTLRKTFVDASSNTQYIPLVSFPANRPPRLCQVGIVDSRLVVIPPTLTDELAKAIPDTGIFKEKFRIDVVIPWMQTASPVFHGPLAFSAQPPSVWYSGLPSLVYNWAPLTFEEAMRKGKTHSWELDKYWELLKQIASAIATLHSENPRLIHGDIRPANILYDANRIEEDEEQTPSRYKLTDYGSFNLPLFNGEDPYLGPVIGRYRRSPFYSPERREPEEYETVNAALVAPLGTDGKSVAVLLGWKSELAEPNGDLKSAALAAIKGDGNLEDSVAGQYLKNDWLRLRNRVFRIERIQKTKKDDQTVYICDPNAAVVFQERLAVKAEQSQPSAELITFPSFSVVMRPSASIDIYGFGALAMYCLVVGSNSDSNERRADAEKDPDTAFRQVMSVLSSKPYFDVLWRGCEVVRQELIEVQKTYKKNPKMPRADILKQEVRPEALAKLDEQDKPTLQPNSDRSQEKGPDDRPTVYELTLLVANNILQSTPHVDWILAKLNYNVATFVLFIQFVLSCLHYAESLSKPIKDAMLPICKSRKDHHDGTAAKELKRRFSELVHAAGSEVCGQFCIAEEVRTKALARFDPRSDFLIRAENASHIEMVKATKERLEKLDQDLKILEETSKSTSGQLQQARGVSEESLKTLKAKDAAYAATATKLSEILAEIHESPGFFSRLRKKQKLVEYVETLTPLKKK